MNTVTFTNDLKNEVVMNVENFKQAVTEAIDFATDEKSYNINDLTVDFIVEDVTGVIESFHMTNHNMSENGLEIIKNTLEEMKSSSKVVITRPINGITINSHEVLLNQNNKPMKFNSKEEAVQFLLTNGFEADDIKQFNFEII